MLNNVISVSQKSRMTFPHVLFRPQANDNQSTDMLRLSDYSIIKIVDNLKQHNVTFWKKTVDCPSKSIHHP